MYWVIDLPLLSMHACMHAESIHTPCQKVCYTYSKIISLLIIYTVHQYIFFQQGWHFLHWRWRPISDFMQPLYHCFKWIPAKMRASPVRFGINSILEVEPGRGFRLGQEYRFRDHCIIIHNVSWIFKMYTYVIKQNLDLVYVDLHTCPARMQGGCVAPPLPPKKTREKRRKKSQNQENLQN